MEKQTKQEKGDRRLNAKLATSLRFDSVTMLDEFIARLKEPRGQVRDAVCAADRRSVYAKWRDGATHEVSENVFSLERRSGREQIRYESDNVFAKGHIHHVPVEISALELWYHRVTDNRYFLRLLSWKETREFVELAGISRYWLVLDFLEDFICKLPDGEMQDFRNLTTYDDIHRACPMGTACRVSECQFAGVRSHYWAEVIFTSDNIVAWTYEFDMSGEGLPIEMWHRGPWGWCYYAHGDRSTYSCRTLTWDEAEEFCRLASIARYWEDDWHPK